MTRWLFGAFLAAALTTPLNAQGIATWIGDRLGVGNAGRAIDNANREVKRAVPLYGQTEEAISGGARHLTQEAVVESSAPILKNYILMSRNDAMSRSAPLPPEILWEFQGFYGADVLNARWSYSWGNDLSLQSNSFRYGDVAGIALDTIVVFRSISDAYSPWLWAHELAHIEQYRRWGVDDFTKRYIRDYASIESQANERANQFMSFRARKLQAARSTPPQPYGGTNYPPLPTPQPQGQMCVTPVNSCGWAGPIGWSCVCASPYGLQNGQIR